MTEIPKYYLADVPHDLRRRVLDVCFKRLWHDGLELLQQQGFNHYTLDDLMNFYSWAPTFLPETCAQHDRSADSLSAFASVPANDNMSLSKEPQPELAERGVHAASSTSASALLTDLRDLLRRYVVLPELAAEALALWVVHTYAFELREVTTYIGVVSPEKRCGKTTLLELLRRLANRPMAAANISAPAMFRVIQENRPTLLIDEADTFLQGRDELAGILNAGYRRENAYVVRVADRKNPDGTEFAQYSCWCPKVMAAIGRLPDTLADRCIVITMQRKLPGEQCERMRNLDAADYRKRCAELVREHSETIAKALPEIPAALNDRAADIWEPLLAIADLAGGEWPHLARQAALKLSSFDDETTLIGHFLKDLRDWMLLKKVDRMLSRDIVAAFNPAHDRPWEDLRHGREINEWWLSQRMKDLGVHSRSIRVGDTIAKGYLLADVAAACRRYLPNAEPEEDKEADAEEV